ncbi:hypothetical protein G6O67_008073 [Ophiocordyceps sinensis]|uniref:SET domain-containing protein n=2 Tax=Ophiocordyceps sinensis TaxID=72228 RepID=A0A8H4LS32_9HYPO|nr:SET domain protein [Ophiocordyceps sinensis CO18]KAF4504648.1 hypothetical protein G6O67_008073 [Ophiocordyceps sinensis]
MSKPKNWPSSLPYLKSPHHSQDLSAAQVGALGTKPPAMPVIRASQMLVPSPHVKIQQIRDAAHPADGQYGLFAAQNLKPGTFILPYLGRVHGGAASSSRAESDYDLWLDREADVAVDAAFEGNEGRFVNDYRGVKERANAEFGTAWCEGWQQVCVAFWVLGGKNSKGIRKGEEILVSYGKGFWDERRC